MPYEAARLLAYQSYQQWISIEFLSFNYFVIMGMVAITYTIWLKLVDTSRLIKILLLGSLCAVGFLIADIILIAYFGVAEYKIAPLPVEPPIFIVSVTKAPILYMLVYQYTSSWKSYALWASIGTAVLSFGLFPLYSLLGIFRLHHWNYFYQFLLMFTGGIIARGLLLWIISIEQSSSESSQVSSMFLGLQPVATKPLDNDKEDIINNDD